MKNTRDVSLYISFGASIAVLLICFASIIIIPAFSDTTDYFNLSVTIGNYQPNVTAVWWADGGGGTVQLSAGANITVTCNASIVDPNGFQDVSQDGNVTGKLWKLGNSSDAAADDDNVHITNYSCYTFGTGAGNYVNVTCGFQLPYYAMNGTWVCNITVEDGGGSTGSNNSSNSIDQLIAVSVSNVTVSFGSMAVGESTATPGKGANFTNLGNVPINVSVAADGDMGCTEIGQIGVGNISYNVTGGARAALAKNLTTVASNVEDFWLGIRGINTTDTVNASKNLYWGVTIPTGVKGTCQNNITATASKAH